MIDVRSEKNLQIDSIRGNIYDVNGKLLAYNEMAYTLTFGNDSYISTQAKNFGISENELKNRILADAIAILWANNDDIDSGFNIKYEKGSYSFRVSGAQLNQFRKDAYAVTSLDDLKDDQKNASAQEMAEYLYKLFEISPDYDRNIAIRILACRYNLWLNRFRQYVPVEIAHNISERSRSSIIEAKDKLLGLDITVTSLRKYNDAEYFAHIIGYVGKASQEDINSLNAENNGKEYDADDYVGKAGVERVFENQLHGIDGNQVMYVDNLGKVIDVKSTTPALAGNDVYLTIDSDLQKYCYDMLQNEISNIIIANLRDIAYAPEYNSKHEIPITDVYAAFFNNNQFDLNSMNSEGATELEHRIYDSFIVHQTQTLDQMNAMLTSNNAPLSELSNEYRDYCEYVCEMLSEAKIYNYGKVDLFSEEFNDYVNHNSSLQDYLKYCISIEAIDIRSIADEDSYNDNSEIFEILRNYIISNLRDNESFNNRILTNMVRQGDITGLDIINLIYDQGILSREGDQEYASVLSGAMNCYNFFVTKLKHSEITPAMLALEPCSGSIVVTDSNTGEVRALVSYPSYDNNYLTNQVDADYYNKLLSNNTSPLLNRSCQMLTAPGSTFKLVTTVAGVNEGVIGLYDFIADEGVFDKVYTKPMCWIYRDYEAVHGVINIPKAIDVSCNYFFYEIGYRLAKLDEGKYNDNKGLTRLNKYAAEFGLDSKSGLELDEAAPHLSDIDAVTSSIGQGTNQYAPVQLSRYVTAVANNGKVYDLTILSKVTDFAGNVVYEQPHNVSNVVEGSDELWNQIHTGMRMVVTDDLKDDKMLNGINVSVAGKTGTAQVGDEHPANSLFVSYAPYSKPEVTVTVIIPNGYTSRNAGQLAGFVYAYMYDKEALVNASFVQDSSSIVGD